MDLLSQFASRAQTRCAQHGHRLPMAANVCLRGVGNGLRCLPGHEPLVWPAPPRAQHELIGLDRQRFLEPELVVVRILEREVAQHQRQRELGFGQRELAADARALALSEWHVGMGGKLRLVLGQEAVDIETLGVRPDLRIAMQRSQHHRDATVLAQPVAAAQHHVVERRHREGGCGRPQPQRFLQHAVEHGHTRQIGIDRRRIAGQHCVDFGIRLRQHARIAQQFIERERQQPLVVSWPAIRNVMT
jgi:hypothetical protein